jgi:hypothetical protein
MAARKHEWYSHQIRVIIITQRHILVEKNELHHHGQHGMSFACRIST